MPERINFPHTLRVDQIILIVINFSTAIINAIHRFELDKFRTFPGKRLKCPKNYPLTPRPDQIILIVTIFLTVIINAINRFYLDKFRTFPGKRLICPKDYPPVPFALTK